MTSGFVHAWINVLQPLMQIDASSGNLVEYFFLFFFVKLIAPILITYKYNGNNEVRIIVSFAYHRFRQ